jgi:hypothetical protein
MAYKDSNELYIDFILERLSREAFLREAMNLTEKERLRLFTFSKMHIFKPLMEKMTGKQGLEN